jgi:hypothetical protein
MRRGIFSFLHPSNSSDLVLLIHESIPEGSRHLRWSLMVEAAASDSILLKVKKGIRH